MVPNRETAVEFLHGCTNPLNITPQHPVGVQVWHMESFLYHQDMKCKINLFFTLFTLLGDVTLSLRMKVIALGWAHQVCAATVK